MRYNFGEFNKIDQIINEANEAIEKSGKEDEVTITTDNVGNVVVSNVNTENEDVVAMSDKEFDKKLSEILVNNGVKVETNSTEEIKEKWMVVLSFVDKDTTDEKIKKFFDSYQEAMDFYEENKSEKYTIQFIKRVSYSKTITNNTTKTSFSDIMHRLRKISRR